MTDKSRAKLRPRSNRNLDNVLNARAASITAQDIADPTVVLTPDATPDLSTGGSPELPTGGSTMPTEPEASTTPQKPEIAAAVPADEIDEDDWVSGLTPVTAGQDLVDPTANSTPRDQEAPAQNAESDKILDTNAEELRLARMRSMTTIDEEVAQEIYNTVLKPELDALRATYDQQVSSISGTLTEQKKRQEEYDKNNLAKSRAKTNDVIISKHPHAGKILQSAEFSAFLKSKQDPYSQQSKYDILNTAYNAGDADYVIRELDAFAETRRKPKPQASVDVNSGGTPNTNGTDKKQPMSEQQYATQRKAIMARRHKPSELTKLYNQYITSQQ